MEKAAYFGEANLIISMLIRLYPDYKNTIEILSKLGIQQDFSSANNTIRFGHRKTADKDIYFVANRTDVFQETAMYFSG
ncbi:MAG: glycosyl hydrolase [Cyclobacteriaceae bacterium]|nr:glycosyl hydrolase [Cyclobacteriaceae bacterium]